jgi:capsular polysaccharide export protein
MKRASLGVVLAPTPALWRLQGLRGFFPEARGLDLTPAPLRETDVVLGWGSGLGARYAARLAGAIGADYLRLEEGLIASVGGLGRGASPISVVADHPRDAAQPSALETILNSDALVDAALLEEARALIAFKREQGLSRHNAGAAVTAGRLGPATARSRVLVVDQAADDPATGLSPDGADAFATMLAHARAEHPGAQVIVLRPGGDRARRRWALPPTALAGDDVVIGDDIDVMALIEQVDAVYVVSSLVGLDALLVGKPVVCFGAPFFAGWGLTDDRGPAVPHRTRRLSPEALFAGAYMLHPRYVDPLSGAPCAPGLAFERLATFKQHARRVAGHWVGLNIPPPKHPVLKAFLVGPHSSYAASPRWSRRGGEGTRFAVWASKPNAAVREAWRASPGQVVNIEDGFLRSVGLGSNFHPASSLVLDHGGIYYDPTTASDLERILNETRFDAASLERARRLRAEVVQLGLSKYNLALPGALNLDGAAGRRIILVPGQVEDDASVRTGGQGWTNLALLTEVRARNPDAFILFKEHPDVTAGNRVGRVPETEARALADLLVRDVDVIRCIEAVDEVHTLTSLTGFEALLRGKRVATYGSPFYGGWGLTEDLQTYPRPRRTLNLDELVAGVLLTYPLYVDPISRLPCDAETFVQRLKVLRAAETAAAPPGILRTQLIRGYRATAQVVLAQRVRPY